MPHPALPVSLVESDAWGRRVPGNTGRVNLFGNDVCDAVGVDAGQTNHIILLLRGETILSKEEEGHRAKNLVVDI